MTTRSPKANAVYRRAQLRFWAAMGFYVAAISLANWLIPKDAEAKLVVVCLVMLPALGLVAMIWSIGRVLIELDDEYLRMLEVRRALAATGVVLTVASVWGLLEVYTDVPRLPALAMLPIWCAGLMVGQFWNWRASL